MLRQALILKGIFLSDAEFEEVMQATTDDVKFNKIRFNKTVKLNEVIEIAVTSAKTFKRCA